MTLENKLWGEGRCKQNGTDDVPSRKHRQGYHPKEKAWSLTKHGSTRARLSTFTHIKKQANCRKRGALWAPKQSQQRRWQGPLRLQRETPSAGHSSKLIIRPLHTASVPTSSFSNILLFLACPCYVHPHRDKTLVHTDKYWLSSFNFQICEFSSSGPKKLPWFNYILRQEIRATKGS